MGYKSQTIMRITYFFIFFTSFFSTLAQTPKKWTSSELHHAIQKLNVRGNVLYIAAHPDDENTSVITYLANYKNFETAYLSLTRGDGGQNLIGPEIRELLGVIRTQELLAARRIDGGQQFFSRANDFGYSKHPSETLQIWDKEKVLSDIVWAIRKFKPDIIINRFAHTSAGKTHGHHTASALLSLEAFDLAADPNKYPEQLKYVSTWQPKSLYYNITRWNPEDLKNFENPENIFTADVGVYYPDKGKSNTEISAESRSQHKCQGMGRALKRGSDIEYFEWIKGERPRNKTSFLDINYGWSGVQNGKKFFENINHIYEQFDYQNPSKSIQQLIQIYQQLQQVDLDKQPWVRQKLTNLKAIIFGCAGLYVEVVTRESMACPGDKIELEIELVNRSAAKVFLKKLSYQPMNVDSLTNHELKENEITKFFKVIHLPTSLSTTSPYWLEKNPTLGMYEVNDQQLIGLPENPRDLKLNYTLEIEGTTMDFDGNFVYKTTDPVKGEYYQNFEITEPIFANIKDNVYIFESHKEKEITITLKAGKQNVSGKVELEIPDGWSCFPKSINFEFAKKGAEKNLSFQLSPPSIQSVGTIKPIVKISNKKYSKRLDIINYDHIPIQTVITEEVAKVVKIDLQKRGEKIAYVMGAGDDIPLCLSQIGYDVNLIDLDKTNQKELNFFDAAIIGVRAYNTIERLPFHQNKLLSYVKQGGTMIVQYNTGHHLKLPSSEIGPYPLSISRDRVTDEFAEVRFLNPEHRILNFPNKITSKDFEGWVQERGLYFPNEWDQNYEAILSANDLDESAKNGGLLVAKYGEGHYIYTGYSWFRELPAGVPGAYRMFVNMISIGQK